MTKKVYIILLNWNAYRDTIECFESLKQLNYSNFRVVICDNNSGDDSWNILQRYMMSNQHEFLTYNKDEIGLLADNEMQDVSVVLIQTGHNLGFAGGNNVGLKYILKKNDFDYVWLLNNDTIVDENSLDNLIRAMEADPFLGICGSRLMNYYFPNDVQSLGGIYNKWFATIQNVQDRNKIEKIDYVIGASMLISKNFLMEVGILSEDYFLYYEELDWRMRSIHKFNIRCVYDSVVYHKEGGSIGSNNNPQLRSEIADYYILKNRVVFTKKFFSKYLITVYIGLLVSFVKRILRGRFKQARNIVKIIINKNK